MFANLLDRPLRVLTWLALCAACSGPAMLLPTAARESASWPLQGYREGRERDFTLGGARVHDLVRSHPPAALARRVIAPTTSSARHYSFRLAAEGVTWQAACDEQVDPKPSIVGFGSRALHLACACAASTDEPHASLSLLNHRGSLQLTNGSRFEISPVHQTADGKSDKQVLGYALSGPRGSGALERTGSGRAFAPPDLDARSSAELRCLYAALLLYRM